MVHSTVMKNTHQYSYRLGYNDQFLTAMGLGSTEIVTYYTDLNLVRTIPYADVGSAS